MKALGFPNVRCGANGPQAWAIAEQWNKRWQKVRIGGAISPSEAERRNLSPGEAEELAIYPEGSIGNAFRRYRRMPGSWAAKSTSNSRRLVAGLEEDQAYLRRCRPFDDNARNDG